MSVSVSYCVGTFNFVLRNSILRIQNDIPKINKMDLFGLKWLNRVFFATVRNTNLYEVQILPDKAFQKFPARTQSQKSKSKPIHYKLIVAYNISLLW